jgi:putative ABC transport system ATP-binding protein
VLAIFSQLNATGRTVIVITHEADVAAHAKRVIRLRDGVILDDARHAPAAGPPPTLAGRLP